MDRADRVGLGAALAGHLALLALLSLSLSWRKPPVVAPVQTMDVQLVDAVGLKSAAPEPATEAPREMAAPDAGTPAEAPPPAPEPTPAPPKPAPPPTVAPLKSAPEKPAPKPEPKPVPKPEPKPAPKPEKAKPEPKPAPAKAKPAASLSDILKDVRSAARNEKAGSDPVAKPGGHAAAQKLSPDFLKGVLGAAAGRGERARAAVSGAAMNGLGAAIKRQVQPCYDLGALGGTPATQITTVLQLRFNPDGSVAGNPQVVEQKGVDDANRGYAKQMVEVSRRAVLRCAPLHLPPELYSGGWENITMGFIPGQLQ